MHMYALLIQFIAIRLNPQFDQYLIAMVWRPPFDYILLLAITSQQHVSVLNYM